MCNKDLDGGITAIKRHELHSIHIKRMKSLKGLQNVITFGIPNPQEAAARDKQRRINEIRNTLFLLEHNMAFNCANHLVELEKVEN